MRVRNYIPENDPYAHSKTALQWRKENRAINVDAQGEELWNNRFCQVSVLYYTLEETHPASPEEVEVWREQQRRQDRDRRRKRKEAELAAAAKEKARIERLVARLRQHITVPPEEVICLDVETTGLHPVYDEILQFSIIDGTGAVLFNEYIRPKRKTEWPGAEAINGISPEMVADKPTIDEYVPRLNEIIAAAKLIVGYNSDGFDLSFIRAAGVDVPSDTPTFDVMLEFAELYGDWNPYYNSWRWQKLYICADFFGYQGNGSFHDSLEDVRATLFCYYAMTEITEADFHET